MNTDKTEALSHPSHATLKDWMPVSEALRLADLWTVGDLDNCGQWRAAIKVLADEVRAALAQRQQVPGDWPSLRDELEDVCKAADQGANGWVRTTRIREALTAAPQAAQAQPRAVEPLTDEQIQAVYTEFMLYQDGLTPSGMKRVARAIERAHGIGKQEQERG